MSLYFASQREATFKDGCLSLRKAVLDNMRARVAPGPIYNPLPCSSSTERGVRSIKFGTGPARYNDISESNGQRVACETNQPGPQTYDPEAIRKSIGMSKRKSTRGIKFGKGERDWSNEDTSKRTQPSPAEYDPEMIRRGVMFSKSGTNITHVKFRKACNKGPQVENNPGPQTYDPEAIKHGIMLTKSKITSSNFGSPPKRRNAPSKRETHPGPQHYDTENIRRGVSALSSKRRPAGVKFTTGPRPYNVAEEKARASKSAPSAYTFRSSIGPQINSRLKSQPRISFGAR